jgi:hypothetical protein
MEPRHPIVAPSLRKERFFLNLIGLVLFIQKFKGHKIIGYKVTYHLPLDCDFLGQHWFSLFLRVVYALLLSNLEWGET